ncbi:MAG: sulfite exporter TauE/SafE family protein [Bacteroidetes bacterium]|nr:sulfite exporter TauE/SafE family protein [Bacteroidota bacterium]
MNTIIILLCVGLLAGILSGMVGIGGGIIIVPALVYFLGVSQHTAQGTTLAMFLMPIGILGVFNYYKAGHVDVKTALIIAITFVLGSFVGSKIAIGLDQTMVKRIFGVIILIISIKMILGK